MIVVKSVSVPGISPERERELSTFQNKVGLSFSNPGLLNNAFTHSSYANESTDSNVKDNERLEFLGDSILGMIVAGWLYNNLDCDEGKFSQIRSSVVSEDALAEIAVDLDISTYLLIGKGEESTGGRQKKAILADCMEAVIASVYLDQGFEKAKQFVLSFIVPRIKISVETGKTKDYKTLLQEYLQKNFQKVPIYNLCRVTGPEHNQKSFYSVDVNGKNYGPQSGHNKKESEQNAAALACKELGIKL